MPLAVSQRPSTIRRSIRRPSERNAPRRLADDFVVEDGRIRAGEIPGLEERTPVDHFGDSGQVLLLEDAPADELRHRRRVARPVDRRLVGARLRQADERCGLLARVQRAHALVVGLELGDEGGGAAVAEQVAADRDRAAGIGHVDHRAVVARRDLDGGVTAARRRAADQQRDLPMRK
jgi:hypothetical protein